MGEDLQFYPHLTYLGVVQLGLSPQFGHLLLLAAVQLGLGHKRGVEAGNSLSHSMISQLAHVF